MNAIGGYYRDREPDPVQVPVATLEERAERERLLAERLAKAIAMNAQNHSNILINPENIKPANQPNLKQPLIQLANQAFN